jgi:hypothetical protein
MEPNATISSWRAPDGTNILFPETEIEVNGEKKQRGGAFVCAPNFGPAPKTGPYTGITLSQHGLVRQCRIKDGQAVPGNPAWSQSEPLRGTDGLLSAGFSFEHPWPHNVLVSAGVSPVTVNQNVIMTHRILVTAEADNDLDMPCTVGFHPYFATGDEAFTLHYDEQDWSAYNLTEGESIYVPHEVGKNFIITTDHGEIEIELVFGYNGFYVWTDQLDKYICVEPVSQAPDTGHWLLQPGGRKDCECRITYTPKEALPVSLQ